MGLIDNLKALFGRRESVQAAEAEAIPEPTDRPTSNQESFEEVKDDDSIARGTTPVAPSVGPGTSKELRDEVASDQEAPEDRAPKV